jgi:Retroviral aspartyl protease
MKSLVQGEAFVVKSKLVYNGMSVTLSSLADSGAGGYVFIRRQLAIQLSRRMGIPIEKTEDTLKLHGYDGTESKEIQEVFTCTLDVRGRRIVDTPMVVVEMHHDIILGREWFARQDVLIDCKRRKLIWPDKRREYVAAHELVLAKETLEVGRPNLKHQQDVERRDRVMDSQPRQPVQILRRPVIGKRTHELQRQEALKQMDKELAMTEEPSQVLTASPKKP